MVFSFLEKYKNKEGNFDNSEIDYLRNTLSYFPKNFKNFKLSSDRLSEWSHFRNDYEMPIYLCKEVWNYAFNLGEVMFSFSFFKYAHTKRKFKEALLEGFFIQGSFLFDDSIYSFDCIDENENHAEIVAGYKLEFRYLNIDGHWDEFMPDYTIPIRYDSHGLLSEPSKKRIDKLEYVFKRFIKPNGKPDLRVKKDEFRNNNKYFKI